MNAPIPRPRQNFLTIASAFAGSVAPDAGAPAGSSDSSTGSSDRPQVGHATVPTSRADPHSGQNGWTFISPPCSREPGRTSSAGSREHTVQEPHDPLAPLGRTGIDDPAVRRSRAQVTLDRHARILGRLVDGID